MEEDSGSENEGTPVAQCNTILFPMLFKLKKKKRSVTWTWHFVQAMPPKVS